MQSASFALQLGGESASTEKENNAIQHLETIFNSSLCTDCGSTLWRTSASSYIFYWIHSYLGVARVDVCFSLIAYPSLILLG